MKRNVSEVVSDNKQEPDALRHPRRNQYLSLASFRTRAETPTLKEPVLHRRKSMKVRVPNWSRKKELRFEGTSFSDESDLANHPLQENASMQSPCKCCRAT